RYSGLSMRRAGAGTQSQQRPLVVSRIMPKAMSRREILKTGLTAASVAAIGGGVTPWPALAQQQGELIIRNGLIVTESGRMEADIRIRGEKIAEIGRNLASTAGAREIDARRMFLIPGGVDTHTHPSLRFRTPPNPKPTQDDSTADPPQRLPAA